MAKAKRTNSKPAPTAPQGAPPQTDSVEARRVASVMNKLNVGQSFAEYDLALEDPDVYVHTPAFTAAGDPRSGKFFYVGRRGMGKTALRRYCASHGLHTRVLIPEIFSPASAFDLELFQNPKKGPFRGLVSVFKRALIDELLLLWREQHPTNANIPATIIDELEGNCALDFDTRALNGIIEVAAGVETEDDLLLASISRGTKLLFEDVKLLQGGRTDYVLLIDSIDDFWDASDQALTYLTAFMHACLEISSHVPWARTLLFLRENIFERVRARDSESSRLETAITGLDWTQRLLVELVERRLNQHLTAKFALGGKTWDSFFEKPTDARDEIFKYCFSRPRDVLIYVSNAIDLAKENGHSQIEIQDVEGARRRFSDNRIKDLGDEYAENYPQIAAVLSRFYGLGRRFTPAGMESLIRTIIADNELAQLCGSWIFEYQSLESFVRLLYNIGFIGLERSGSRAPKYRALGPQDTSPPALTSDITLVVHQCYWDALDLQDALMREVPRGHELGRIGVVSDLPEGLDPTSYASLLDTLDERLSSTPEGRGKPASDFEEIVGEILKLCFFRGLNNIEPKSRSIEGEVIRDWITSVRTDIGFWAMVRQKYDATQIVWECKNYQDLSADDFHQSTYYMNDAIGKFVVVAYRGEMKDSYYRHIKRVVGQARGMILPLGMKDLKVFLRQARNGKSKEDHIQDRFDAVVRKIS